MLKRFRYSDAYIDSYLVVIHFIAGIVIAGVFAYVLQHAISPIWIFLAIMTTFTYYVLIYWLLRQFDSVTRIFIIFIFGVISLSLISSVVIALTQLRLPTDLPIVIYLRGFIPYHISTYDPASIAIFYGLMTHVFSSVISIPLKLLNNTSGLKKLIKITWLDRIDLRSDVGLDKLALYLDGSKYAWLVVLITLILSVIGFIALLTIGLLPR